MTKFEDFKPLFVIGMSKTFKFNRLLSTGVTLEVLEPFMVLVALPGLSNKTAYRLNVTLTMA